MGALEEVRDLAEAVARRRSIRLWDVELGGQPGRSVVRVFVESDGGIDLDTVAQVSEEISRGLDLKDPIPGSYTLEVSSPGLERNLRLPEHFARSVGREVVVKTKEILHGNSHRLEGTVAGVDDGTVRIALSTGEINIPIEEIKSARTVFEWGGHSASGKKRGTR
jgi:ribosome maturation factor RimP